LSELLDKLIEGRGEHLPRYSCIFVPSRSEVNDPLTGEVNSM
jgi:hypothetical protein